MIMTMQPVTDSRLFWQVFLKEEVKSEDLKTAFNKALSVLNTVNFAIMDCVNYCVQIVKENLELQNADFFKSNSKPVKFYMDLFQEVVSELENKNKEGLDKKFKEKIIALISEKWIQIQIASFHSISSISNTEMKVNKSQVWLQEFNADVEYFASVKEVQTDKLLEEMKASTLLAFTHYLHALQLKQIERQIKCFNEELNPIDGQNFLNQAEVDVESTIKLMQDCFDQRIPKKAEEGLAELGTSTATMLKFRDPQTQALFNQFFKSTTTKIAPSK
jgi:hypothetical protein